jgi:hypothetical protein
VPGAAFVNEEGVVVQYSRREIADMLRKAGLGEAADQAMVELPDPVDLDYALEWGIRHGITRDALISQLGGSP